MSVLTILRKDDLFEKKKTPILHGYEYAADVRLGRHSSSGASHVYITPSPSKPVSWD
jgi:hypothetical protein